MVLSRRPVLDRFRPRTEKNFRWKVFCLCEEYEERFYGYDLNILRNTSCGILTFPIPLSFIFFFPFFCFSRSFIFRVISPPYMCWVTSLLKAETVREEIIRPRALACTFMTNIWRGRSE